MDQGDPKEWGCGLRLTEEGEGGCFRWNPSSYNSLYWTCLNQGGHPQRGMGVGGSGFLNLTFNLVLLPCPSHLSSLRDAQLFVDWSNGPGHPHSAYRWFTQGPPGFDFKGLREKELFAPPCLVVSLSPCTRTIWLSNALCQEMVPHVPLRLMPFMAKPISVFFPGLLGWRKRSQSQFCGDLDGGNFTRWCIAWEKAPHLPKYLSAWCCIAGNSITKYPILWAIGF